MLYEIEVKVIEADRSIKCQKCGKGFRVGSFIVTRGYASDYGHEEMSRQKRIFHGLVGDCYFLHKQCNK